MDELPSSYRHLSLRSLRLRSVAIPDQAIQAKQVDYQPSSSPDKVASITATAGQPGDTIPPHTAAAIAAIMFSS